MKKHGLTLMAVLITGAAFATCYIDTNKNCPGTLAISNPPWACTGNNMAGSPYPFTATAANGKSAVVPDSYQHCTYGCYAWNEEHTESTWLSTSAYTGARTTGSACP